MSKKDFLEKLKHRISHLPNHDVEKALVFYDESIDDRVEDGMSEDEAIESLGSIEEIASSIEQSISIPILVKEKIKESHKKSSNKGLWIAVFVLGFPIWISVLFTVISIVFSAYMAVASLLFGGYAAVVGFGVSGVAGIIAGILNCFTKEVLGGVMMIGGSLAAIGISIIFLGIMNFITLKFIQLNKFIILKIKSSIFRKKGVK